MTPFRRGAGGYFSIYVPQGPGTKQLSLGTTDARLANRIAAMVKHLKNTKQWDLLREIVKEQKRITVDDLWVAYQDNTLDALRDRMRAIALATMLPGWKADVRVNAPASSADQIRQVTKLLGDLGEGLPALQYSDELTPGTIRDRLNALDVTGGTARHYLYAMSSFCGYLVAHGVLPSNPCLDRDLIPRPKKAKKRREWRTADIDERIALRTEEPVRIALIVCASTGADLSTTLLMRVRDIKLLPPKSRPRPLDSLEHRADIPGTKSETRDRKGVRIEPWAVPYLRAWLAGKRPDELLVTGCSADMLTRHWRIAADKEGQVNYWLRDTRHSYGVRALLAGYPLWEISQWLGHADIATTAGIYLQFDYEVARAVRASSARGFTTPDTTRDEHPFPVREA